MNELHETLITSKVAYNISYLAIFLSTLLVVYSHLTPFNTYKTIGFIFISIIPAVYVVLLIFNVDGLSQITQIETSSLTLANYFATTLCVVTTAAVYLLTLNIIEIVKGETDYVKNKSRS